MGQEHNELRRGPLSAALSNALGDTRGCGLERYGETLTPTIDLWGRPELAFLRAEGLFMGTVAKVAVIGEFSAVGISNPSESGGLVVVEAVYSMTIPSDMVVADGATDPVFTTAGSVRRRDLRQRTAGGFVAPIARIGGISLIAQPTNPGWRYNGDNAFPQRTGFTPLIVPPGGSFFVSAMSANLELIVSFRWRERVVFSGELV